MRFWILNELSCQIFAMVQACCVYACKNRCVKGCGKSFHQFPVDKNIRDKWVIATKRKNFKPSKYSVICSDHFLATDYVETMEGFGSTMRKKLYSNSVPSVFKLCDHLQPKIRKTNNSKTANPLARCVDVINFIHPKKSANDNNADFSNEPQSKDNLQNQINVLRKRYKSLLSKFYRIKRQNLRLNKQLLHIKSSKSKQKSPPLNFGSRLICGLKKSAMIKTCDSLPANCSIIAPKHTVFFAKLYLCQHHQR